jgi:ABC-type multidrug transport system fused ATPase/permease subunit
LVILVAAAAARFTILFTSVDLTNPEMWEFGIIARNLLSGIGFQHTALTTNVPSAYMPPALPYIYYLFFSLFGDNSTGYVLILSLNILISSAAVIIIYYVSQLIYNKNTALFTAAYAAFYPVYVYSALIFSPVIYFHLFSSLCYLYFIKSFSYKNNTGNSTIKYSLLLAVTIGIFIYFRAEILILVFVFFLIYFINKQFKQSLLILFIPLIIISPWTIRNYIVFDKFIPVTTSAGYNFYTGHGDEQSTIDYNNKINSLTEDSEFEIKKSDISYEEGFKYIQTKPVEDIKESLIRVIDLWIIDRYREIPFNPLHMIPWFFTLFLFAGGYYYSKKDKRISAKLLFLRIFMMFVTILVIIFFNIPRYRIQISFIMIPTAMFLFSKLFSKNR